jgi:hypothetical protein
MGDGNYRSILKEPIPFEKELIPFKNRKLTPEGVSSFFLT